jgi:hypothetical protein
MEEGCFFNCAVYVIAFIITSTLVLGGAMKLALELV